MSVKMKLLFAVCCIALCFTGNLLADPNLVAIWEMDGDATDSSGNGWDTTSQGSPGFVLSPIGMAASLNGTTDYFTINNSTTWNFNDGVTIAAWMKAPLGVGFQPILANGIGTDDGWGFQQYSTLNRMSFYTLGNDFQHDPVNPFDNAWHHIAVTAAAGTKTLYFDGAEVATRAYTGGLGTNPNARAFWIGNNPESTARFWGGLIDDLCLFSRALDSWEIAEICSKGIRGFLYGDYMASAPSPAHREAVDSSTPSLSWTLPQPAQAGDTVTCDVLFGEDPTFATATLLVDDQSVQSVGVSLDTNKTYYWRVDCYDPNTGGVAFSTKGQLWAFSTLSLKASAPTPANGGQFDPLGTLSWLPGSGVESHRVYFSKIEQEVIDGTVAYVTKNATDPNYKPSAALDFNTTYYWRVDEVSNGGSTVTVGDVWNFTTNQFTRLDYFEANYSTEAELQAVWSGSINLPQLSPSNWLAMYHSTSQQTFWRTFDEALDLSKGARLSMQYNYNSMSCGTLMPQLTVRLLDASQTVQYSGVLDTTGQNPGSAYYGDLDLGPAGDLSAITKVELVLDGYPGGCDLFLAVRYINVGAPICSTEKPAYDINGDCVVDIADLAVIAGDWTECTLSNPLDCP